MFGASSKYDWQARIIRSIYRSYIEVILLVKRKFRNGVQFRTADNKPNGVKLAYGALPGIVAGEEEDRALLHNNDTPMNNDATPRRFGFFLVTQRPIPYTPSPK
jgi:hypothetical protein